mmetsp:Transcript_13884/g.45955  ORF Transcript_13884/g.45955 Transcript_13884/m.45955 type:complete len:208 (-) Transcript_13884:679-1302(-)
MHPPVVAPETLRKVTVRHIVNPPPVRFGVRVSPRRTRRLFLLISAHPVPLREPAAKLQCVFFPLRPSAARASRSSDVVLTVRRPVWRKPTTRVGGYAAGVARQCVGARVGYSRELRGKRTALGVGYLGRPRHLPGENTRRVRRGRRVRPAVACPELEHSPAPFVPGRRRSDVITGSPCVSQQRRRALQPRARRRCVVVVPPARPVFK